MNKIKLNKEEVQKIKRNCLEILKKFKKEPVKLKQNLFYNLEKDNEFNKEIYIYYTRDMEGITAMEFGFVIKNQEKPIFEFDNDTLLIYKKIKKLNII